ncbi:GYD domain-containing protein, partial [uncultured Bradyrhizobium sp.]
MHFCFSGEYTPRAINNIMENPATNRYEAAKKLIEAGGGKLISMYSTSVDGPGVMVIFDVPDPTVAPAISGVVVDPAGRPAEGVRVCAATPAIELEWRENGQLLGLPLPVGEADPKAAKGTPGRACTLITGQERWPDSARLVAPPDAELSVKLQ